MTEVVAGRFELIDQIGSGGAGSVWRAYDRAQRRHCAAKLVAGRDSRVVVRVLREQGVRLAHPHVLSPYAWAAEDDVVLLATDLMHGGSLSTLIRDYGALPWRYATEIIAQLLDALAHVHAAGVVHRDVKPANILLDATGTGAPHARLADFGIAYEMDGPRLTEMGFVIGTPGYLAPEVLAGRAPHPSQDLFSVGVVAWQLLAGKERPGERIGDAAPPGVPELVWTIVSTLLEPDPARRPSGAAVAHGMLQQVMAPEPLRLPARTPDGEPIEIFDVLGPLPDRPSGSDSAATGQAAESAPTVVPAPAPPPAAPMPTPTRPGPPETPAPRRRWRLVAAAAAGVLAVATGLAVLLPGLLSGGGQQQPGSAPASATATATSASPPSAPATRPAGRGRPGVRAGAPCDWQDVAVLETGEDGKLVRCAQQPGGTYTWQPAN